MSEKKLLRKADPDVEFVGYVKDKTEQKELSSSEKSGVLIHFPIAFPHNPRECAERHSPGHSRTGPRAAVDSDMCHLLSVI
ncbi:hypothetical protein STEG23_026062 [Scotinomys teguina]